MKFDKFFDKIDSVYAKTYFNIIYQICTRKNENVSAYQWVDNFEKEYKRFDVVEDEEEIEIVRLI